MGKTGRTRKSYVEDIDRESLEKALMSAASYREALTSLGKYYCSGAIVALRQAALRHQIAIPHLDGKSGPLADAASAIRRKFKRRRLLDSEFRRGEPEAYARFILYDSRRNDKKRGYANDLSIPTIIKLLSLGECTYCGDTKTKLTLDRVDNTKGHTVDNVNVACARCNIMRGNMPYDAWTHLVPSVRSAFETGLFGDWKPFNHQYRNRR